MKIKTIKMFECKIAKGWTLHSSEIPTKKDCLNKIMEFAHGKDIKIYEHIFRNEWEIDKGNPPYKDKEGDLITPGIRTWYVDIYYQKK